MGLVGGQPASTDIETSTEGILKIVERTAVLQLQKYSNLGFEDIGKEYRWSESVEEIEKRDYLNEFIEMLYENNFVYVRFDGVIMNW